MTVFAPLSDAKNDASLACAVSRMEMTLVGIEKKMESLDAIEKTIDKTKIAVGVGTAVIVACAGITWFVFGNYLGKILEVLSAMVLN